jgi:hypothetical protein
MSGFRRLFIVDIENYCGQSALTIGDANEASVAFASVFHPTNRDLIVIGTSHQLNCLNTGIGWKGPRLVLKHGKDGADRALMEVLEESTIENMSEVIIVSGDNCFAEAIHMLKVRGIAASIASLPKSFSRRLADAKCPVRFLRQPIPQRRAA